MEALLKSADPVGRSANQARDDTDGLGYEYSVSKKHGDDYLRLAREETRNREYAFDDEGLAVESNLVADHGARIVEMRSYAADATEDQLTRELAAVSRRLVDTPDDWDLFNRVPVDQRSSNPLTKLYAKLKDETFVMRRYAIALIRAAAKLQIEYLGAQSKHEELRKESGLARLARAPQESPTGDKELDRDMLPVLNDIHVEGKVALHARCKARNALEEARRAVAVAEKMFVSMHFMSKLVSALDQLAHGDEYCDSLSSSYSQRQAVQMYTASIRQTFLSEEQRQRLAFLEKMMQIPSQISAKQLKDYTLEHKDIEKLCSSEFASLPPEAKQPSDEDRVAGLEMAERMRDIHLNWAAGYFEDVAAKDRWDFMRALKNKMGQNCLGYVSDFKIMITPNSGKGRLCLDAFWTNTLLGKQKKPDVWYSGRRKDINELLNSDLIPVVEDAITLLEDRAAELQNWKPDLVHYAKSRVDS